MKKVLVAGGAIIGAALVARRCAAKCGQIDFEKMIERMPDGAPPKWMFRNINAIRENTERILERLDRDFALNPGGKSGGSHAAEDEVLAAQ